MARRNPKIPAADLREVKRLSSLLWSQGGQGRLTEADTDQLIALWRKHGVPLPIEIQQGLQEKKERARQRWLLQKQQREPLTSDELEEYYGDWKWGKAAYWPPDCDGPSWPIHGWDSGPHWSYPVRGDLELLAETAKNPRRPRSTGYVAAKIRANTARRNATEKFPEGLTERDVPPGHREWPRPQYFSAAHMRAKYAELDDLYARGVINEETHQRLRGELRYGGRGATRKGPTIGRQLKRLERQAKRRADRAWVLSADVPRSRKARGLPVDVWKSRIERLLSDGHWEGAADSLQALAKQQKRRGKKRKQYAWEKAAWQESRRQRAMAQTSLQTPTRFTGRHAPELRSLYRQQLAEAEAPWISREEARTPGDPFAEFMYHEGAEEHFRENPNYAARTVRRILARRGPTGTSMIVLEAGDDGVSKLQVLTAIKRMRDAGVVRAVGEGTRPKEWIWALRGGGPPGNA